MAPISRYTGMAALMAAAIALPVLLSLPAGEAATPEPAACGAQSCPAGARLRSVYQSQPETWPPAHVDEGIDYIELGALPEPDQAPDPALAALGEQLFHDPALSASGQISCANCHSPELSFTDRLRTSYDQLARAYAAASASGAASSRSSSEAIPPTSATQKMTSHLPR